ncbi:MAG: glycosyltransferase family 4 protein [Rhizobiaceae bacterium]|nr:glycosyltransferase family 4 protein [Rhizobiaceae bacterium]
MKVAIVRRHFARTGGAERFIVDILRSLEGRGVDARILSEHFDASADLASRWVKVDGSRGGRLAKARGFEDKVAAILSAGGFDFVQSHERILRADIFRAGDGVHAAWIDRLRRSRPWWRRPFTGRDAFHRHVMETERRMARDTGMVFVANSPLVARELSDWLSVPPHRLTTIENGVDLDRFTPASPRERLDARKRLAVPESVPLAVFVGSGFERKGAPEFVEALALPALRGVHGIVAGGDRTEARLRHRISRLGLDGRVTVTGPTKEVTTILHAADLFVLPTLYDPMPNAALEAIACGLPVVTTADAGIFEAIAETGAGAVTDRQPEALAAAIAATLSRLGDAGAAARALRGRFDLRQATERWLEFYRTMA